MQVSNENALCLQSNRLQVFYRIEYFPTLGWSLSLQFYLKKDSLASIISRRFKRNCLKQFFNRHLRTTASALCFIQNDINFLKLIFYVFFNANDSMITTTSTAVKVIIETNTFLK